MKKTYFVRPDGRIISVDDLALRGVSTENERGSYVFGWEWAKRVSCFYRRGEHEKAVYAAVDSWGEKYEKGWKVKMKWKGR